ncbi:MAG: TolC family protein, partial [Gemmatimonadales bacterium]
MLESLLCLIVLAARAQDSVPLRLSLGDAVARAAQASPAVELAGRRTDEAAARVRQARAGLLPSLTGSAGWLNRTFNRASLGFDFPTAPGTPAPPDLIGPFDNVDARLRLTQALVDYAAWARVRSARALVSGTEAEGAVVREAAAETAALAYLGAVRAEALVAARALDSALAAELLGLARAQHEVGASPTIDVTRARTQL